EGLRPQATSLLLESGERQPRPLVSARLLEHLEEWLSMHETEGFGPVADRWRELSSTLGRKVRITGDERPIEGDAVDLAEDGALLVPPMVFPLEQMSKRFFGRKPLFVGPGVKTGMPVLYDNPREVGADRIVNAVAAYDKWPQGLVIVDFGTATTFDAVTPKGEYLGGAIAPGIAISMEALFHRASKLPRVGFEKPEHVVGRNTVASMQSGLVYGYVGLV